MLCFQENYIFLYFWGKGRLSIFLDAEPVFPPEMQKCVVIVKTTHFIRNQLKDIRYTRIMMGHPVHPKTMASSLTHLYFIETSCQLVIALLAGFAFWVFALLKVSKIMFFVDMWHKVFTSDYIDNYNCITPAKDLSKYFDCRFLYCIILTKPLYFLGYAMLQFTRNLGSF